MVTGNVTWTGGNFTPTIDATANATECNTWRIDGTLNINPPANSPAPPTINPIPNPLNANPGANRKWEPVIKAAGGLAAGSGDPVVPMGYKLFRKNFGQKGTGVQYDIGT